MAAILWAVWVGCTLLALAALLVLITTTLLAVLVGPVDALVTTATGGFSSNIDFIDVFPNLVDGFPNMVQGFPNTAESLPTTTGVLTVPVSMGFALSWLPMVGNMIMCLTGGFCSDTAAVGCFRGRPRRRDATTCNVSADDGGDFAAIFSANSRQLISHRVVST